MSDQEYIDYAKKIYEEVYNMSTVTVNSMADYALTRIRKCHRDLFPLKEEWTRRQSNTANAVDVMTILAAKGFALADMHPKMESILDETIMDRYNGIDTKSHFFVKYRYITDFNLLQEVKERIYAKLKERHDSIVMKKLVDFYPDLQDVQPISR